jgi:hypothetical protein
LNFAEELSPMSNVRCARRGAAIVAAFLMFGLMGCGGGKNPVHGIVTLDDGSPLSKGLVIFERVDGGPPLTARGNVQPDGRYELSTEKPGDGVPTGRYKVAINPLDTSDVPDEKKVLPFDVKYVNLKTSGLEYEVKPGPNDYPIKLTRRR